MLGVLQPILIGAVLGYLFNPLMRRIDPHDLEYTHGSDLSDVVWSDHLYGRTGAHTEYYEPGEYDVSECGELYRMV